MIKSLVKEFSITENYRAERAEMEILADELIDPAEMPEEPDNDVAISEKGLADFEEVEKTIVDCVDFLWLLADYPLERGDVRVVREALTAGLEITDRVLADNYEVTEDDN